MAETNEASEYDRDATISLVAEYLRCLFLGPEQTRQLAENVTDLVFVETSKDMYALTQTMDGLTDDLVKARRRVADAEKAISKIGYCDPAPHEAREHYERKYGRIEE